MNSNLSTRSPAALHELWNAGTLPEEALQRAQLTGDDPALPSSFAVGCAAQSSIAAAALAATEIGRMRNGVVQSVLVDMRHAALECCTHFTIDGITPAMWDKLSGLYPCADGWVRIHANFAHHRDAA